MRFSGIRITASTHVEAVIMMTYCGLDKKNRNDWHHDEEKDLWYWFDGAGMMITNTWYQYKCDWYYLNTDGVMLKGILIPESGKVYCLDGEGKMVVWIQ